MPGELPKRFTSAAKIGPKESVPSVSVSARFLAVTAIVPVIQASAMNQNTQGGKGGAFVRGDRAGGHQQSEDTEADPGGTPGSMHGDRVAGLLGPHSCCELGDPAKNGS